MPLPLWKQEPATPRQISYIDDLANELGFDTERKLAHIRTILADAYHKGTFNMRKWEASKVIDQFKHWRDEMKERDRREESLADSGYYDE